MGRTGTMFAFESDGIVPDILCLAKAFGGGMPLGAFVASREVMGVLQRDPALGHITTFGGHPVCCAAGLASIEYILDNDLAAAAQKRGELYETLLKPHPAVREIRRAGLLMAVELGDSARLFRLMELFKEESILSDWFLFCDTAFRISPPLTVTEEEVRWSCDVIKACLDRLAE
jgi:acetylornithine/succinyldiaminopimelate/putrescine aminotransferase